MTGPATGARGGCRRTASGLAYEDLGDRAGVPFIWAHGLTWSRDSEDAINLFDWSRCPGVRVIRYDARGHGFSAPPPSSREATWRVLATDLLEVMDTVGVERCVIGGASMGCATALHVALRSPDRVDRLILAAPPTAWGTRARQRELYEHDAARVERDGMSSYLLQAAQSPVPEAFDEIGAQLRDASTAQLATFDPVVLARLLRGAAASDLPEPSRLRQLHASALLLSWTDDPNHPLATAHELAEVLPHASLHVASGFAEILAWPDLVGPFVLGHVA